MRISIQSLFIFLFCLFFSALYGAFARPPLIEHHYVFEKRASKPTISANQNAAPARRAEAALTAQAPQLKPRPTKVVGTPAEEASSASRIRQASAREEQGRRVRGVGTQQREAPHTAPKTQQKRLPEEAPTTVPKLPNIDGLSISHSKKMTAHNQGMRALEKKQEAAALQKGKSTFHGTRGQAQSTVAQTRTAQPTAMPQARVQPSPAPQPRVEQPGNVISQPSHSAQLLTNKYNLRHSLAREQQMKEPGTIIAGPGTQDPFRDAPRVVAQYGGEIKDWVKKSSSKYSPVDGAAFETHWVENLKTGKRIDFKIKVIEKKKK